MLYHLSYSTISFWDCKDSHFFVACKFLFVTFKSEIYVHILGKNHYIQVVLPVKLEWFPWYCSDMELEQGTRVSVRFGRNVYIGFVLEKGGQPDIDPERIKPVIQVESQLERISGDEIKLWRFISEYYMCTLGEVYKAAYPALRVEAENKKARTKLEPECKGRSARLTETEKKAVVQILDSFDEKKAVLLHSLSRQAIYDELIRRTLEKGKDVLVLNPGAKRMSSTERRDFAEMLRSNQAVVVRSSRTAVFLPFHKLGLVIIDEEQDITYKQEAPSPRYNARDVAIVLARLHDADVVLGSSAPSLESFYNVITGKYKFVRSDMEQAQGKEVLLIDTDAERKKNGMVGELSRVLLAEKDALEAAKKKVLIVNSWELGNISKLKLGKYPLVAVLHFEFLFSKQDFRADEKAWQTFEKLKAATGGKLVLSASSQMAASYPIPVLTMNLPSTTPYDGS